MIALPQGGSVTITIRAEEPINEEDFLILKPQAAIEMANCLTDLGQALRPKSEDRLMSYSEDSDGQVVLRMSREERRMKIFTMNDCDWMAAETLADAMAEYAKMCGAPTALPRDEVFDDPGEISAAQYEGLMFCDEDRVNRTFREQLNLMISRGEKFPCFFASTEC